MDIDLIDLCRILSERARKVWLPGGRLVIDESVYEYIGESPVHIFIPRKPHPNGQMSYGLACRSSTQELPCLLDFEPYLPGNRVSAREAARRLVGRFVEDHSELAPQFVLDAAFGSFSEIEYYKDIEVNVTYSMPSNENKWLWDLLLHDCPIEQGRCAIVPYSDGQNSFLVSAFRTMNEKHKVIDIYTASNGFGAQPPDEIEAVVTFVEGAQFDESGTRLYQTSWASGEVTMEPISSFMDEDGTFNDKWLSIAALDDVKAALTDKTNEQLHLILDTQGWKVFTPICRNKYISLYYF
jgi:Transposase IS4